MAISGIASPIAGTIITVSFADLNYKDPLTYAIALLGGFNGQPGGSNKWLVSSGSETATWVARTTAVLAALGYTPVNDAGDTMSGHLDFGSDGVGVRLSQSGTLVDYNTDGTTLFAGDDVFRILNQAASVVIFRAAAADAAPTFKGHTIWHSNNTDGAVTTAKLADLAVTAAKLATDAVETAKIKDLAVTAAKLAGGTAVANLGFTPSRIISGTYSGTGATSARQITTGFAVKLVIIHQPAADVMYVAINTTSSLRLGPSPNFIQGSASVHTHASDGFVVSDGSVQGNVSGADNYSYTAFG